MQQGLLTEYEWRKQASKGRGHHPNWWGAQCVYPSQRQKLAGDRSFMIFLLLVALMIASLLPVFVPQRTVFVQLGQIEAERHQEFQARKVKAVTYQMPGDLQCNQKIFTRFQLLRGRMMLLDPAHPLPDDLPPANTVSIAKYAKGSIPVQSLEIKTGYQTADALAELFTELKSRGVTGLYITHGTVSTAQQKKTMITLARELLKEETVQNAVQIVRETLDAPGTGSFLQEYTIEVRTADGFPLENTVEGQAFLQLCWRYGFVRESKEQPFRFRYTGKAHAAAMTYLDLDLKSYLEWLHRKETLVIHAGGKPQYLVLCTKMSGDYAAFDLPENTLCEVSLDNMGYALAACTF